MSLRGPKSMRKVDGLIVIFIDLYIPVLTRRLCSTETLLQLSENINLLVVCRICTRVYHQQRDIDTRCLGCIILLYIYIYCTIWGIGQNLVAPLLVYPQAKTFHFLPRQNFPWERKELISSIRLIVNVNSNNLYSKPKCHIVWKVFSVSKNTAAVDMLLKFKVTSISLIHWSVMLWWAQKPNWLD
jgi:hypothetical protein